MAISFNNIAVEESSTITAKVATVLITRGSTNEMQEILVLGDPQTSNALARVVAVPPLSTEFGLIVRIAGGPSSVADLAVRAVLSSTIADNLVTVAPLAGSTWAVRPLQSSAADLQMTATPAAGSTWNVRPLQSSAADLQMTATPAAGSTWSVRPIQSSQADLRITAYQSTAADLLATVTPAAGSTWSVRPLQSSAADLQVTATPAAGSTWNVRPLQSSAADLQMTATPAAGSTWRTQPGSTLWASSAGFHFDSSGAMIVAGAFSAQFSSTKADNLVTVYQSSAAELQATVTPAAGSTWAVRPLQSSAADLQATVTPAAGSTWSVRPLQSSQADLRITAYQSTAADFLATVSPAAGSTWSVRPLQSSAADLQVTATIGVNLQSTAAPSSNSSGLVVRQVIDALLTTASSNAFASSGLVIQSSGAGLRSYVTAYTITTTNAGPTRVGFYDSTGATLLWPVVLGALSSGISGVNLAVGAPAYLFRGAAAANLMLSIPSSQAGWKVGVSYFRAP